jgi:hypothetical protein
MSPYSCCSPGRLLTPFTQRPIAVILCKEMHLSSSLMTSWLQDPSLRKLCWRTSAVQQLNFSSLKSQVNRVEEHPELVSLSKFA